jgi:hypothetical protein
MNDSHRAISVQDTRIEDVAAELTGAAYGVALRYLSRGSWLDLELDLWRVLADAVREQGLPRGQ